MMEWLKRFLGFEAILAHTHKWNEFAFHTTIHAKRCSYKRYKCDECGKVMVTKEYPDGSTFKHIME